jgi:hypothetical protein
VRKALFMGVGVLLVVVGAVWFLQGVGVLPGSVMTGVTIWAIIGPLVAVAGAGLVVAGLRTRT